jgi:hypothetical protein
MIETFFLSPDRLHMVTNGLLVRSKLIKRRREFEKELGRGAECILKGALETKMMATIVDVPLPIDHLLRHNPNYAELLMPARSVN